MSTNYTTRKVVKGRQWQAARSAGEEAPCRAGGGMTEFRFLNHRQGKRVVADFRRLLETGDIAKLTPGLYHALTMYGGFIAHFSLAGFRSVYDGRLSALIDGELHPLTDPVCEAPSMDESGYTDGMSARGVMLAISAVACELEGRVREREKRVADERELQMLRLLAAKHGIEL